jgi:hypothetical protein
LDALVRRGWESTGSQTKRSKKQSFKKDKRSRSQKTVDEENFEITKNGSLRKMSLEEKRKEARKPLFLRRYE